MAYAPSTTLDPTNVMGRRIGAFIIDVVVPSVIAIAVGWSVFVGSATKITGVTSNYCTFSNRPLHTACFQVGHDAYVGTSADARHAFAVGGLVYLIGALNLFVVQGLSGAAVGKHIFGLRVIRADGSLVGFGWNALRTVFLVVDEFFCFLVGLITASVTHPHRRVGDFVAGSYVVGKNAVGTLIPGATAVAYPPAWTPPPAGQPWGAPQQGGQQWGAPPAAAQPQQWGAPTTTAPQPAATPPAWGTPAATPPVAAPPAAEPPPDTATDAPGWAAPAPTAAAPPVAAEAQQAPAPSAPAREAQWDAQRNAWVYWEAETSRWLQFDPASGQWGPLR